MTTLVYDHIESSLNELPIQNRTMIRLLLLQYFSVPQEEIEYMAADQPASRFMAGVQPAEKRGSKEAIDNVSGRAGQYHLLLRQKRERPGRQIECLEQLIAHTAKEIQMAETMLSTEFELGRDRIQEAKDQAFTALVREARRQLDRGVEQGEIAEKEYPAKRLLLEYQLLLRRQERQRRRLKVAKQEFHIAGSSPLQDHEIAHIWGIPLGSLAARKVKALQQYLLTVQGYVQKTNGQANSAEPQQDQARPDYWQQTLGVLSTRPLERSVVSYTGQERSEDTLMEKLQSLATRQMAEDEETRFWGNITKIHDSEHSGMWTSHERAIFSLQRLSAILKDIDQSDDAIEENLRSRITPPSLAEQLPEPEQPEETGELSEEALGVLQKLVGELDDKRRN